VATLRFWIVLFKTLKPRFYYIETLKSFKSLALELQWRCPAMSRKQAPRF
jgi:hypothetical protein